MLSSYRATVNEVPVLCMLDAGIFPDPWNELQWHDEIINNTNEVTLFGSRGSESGFVTIGFLDNLIEIKRIGVIPGLRRKGLGRQYLQTVFSKASEAGITQIQLEVSADNLAAKELYIEAGFTEFHVRKKYYRSGLDAICMRMVFVDRLKF